MYISFTQGIAAPITYYIWFLFEFNIEWYPSHYQAAPLEQYLKQIAFQIKLGMSTMSRIERS